MLVQSMQISVMCNWRRYRLGLSSKCMYQSV